MLITLPTVPGSERVRILEVTLRKAAHFSHWVDLGCGEAAATVVLCVPPEVARINVDVVAPKSPPPGTFIQCDIQKFVDQSVFGDSHLTSLLDVIEHFSMEEGLRLLEKLEKKSRAIVVFTPDGFYPQDGATNPEFRDNPWQWHRSGWTCRDFLDRGYVVVRFPQLHSRFGGLAAVWIRDWHPAMRRAWRLGVERIRLRTFVNPQTCLGAVKESIRFRYGESFWYAAGRNLHRKWLNK